LAPRLGTHVVGKAQHVRARIAGAIVRAQEARGLSTAELASRSTVERVRLESILRGETDLCLDTIYLLAGSLEVRPAQLLEGIEWIPDGKGGGEFQVEDLERG
jgi:transcriptional regulator with XRE-family HTH domain